MSSAGKRRAQARSMDIPFAGRQENGIYRDYSFGYSAIGALIFAIAVGAAHAADNDYPTSSRADYVFGCMAPNGNTREALLKCSCAIDTIASLMPYSHYEQAETALSLRRGAASVGGLGRSVIRPRSRRSSKSCIEPRPRPTCSAGDNHRRRGYICLPCGQLSQSALALENPPLSPPRPPRTKKAAQTPPDNATSTRRNIRIIDPELHKNAAKKSRLSAVPELFGWLTSFASIGKSGSERSRKVSFILPSRSSASAWSLLAGAEQPPDPLINGAVPKG